MLDHFLSTRREHPNCGVAECLEKSLQAVTIPVVVTALTTIAGFAALMVSPIPAIQQLGLYSCVGIFFSNAFAILFTPALLRLLDVPVPALTTKSSSRWGLRLEERSDWLKRHAKQGW